MSIFGNERVDALARVTAVTQSIIDNTVFLIDVGISIRTHFSDESEAKSCFMTSAYLAGCGGRLAHKTLSIF